MQWRYLAIGLSTKKLEYIHNNPVVEMIVTNPWDYLFSSARNYAEMESLLDVVTIDSRLITYC